MGIDSTAVQKEVQSFPKLQKLNTEVFGLHGGG